MNPPFLIEDGVVKIQVKWEDVFITIPFDFSKEHDIIIYKLFRGMQEQMEKMQNQITSLQGGRDSILVSSSKLIKEEVLEKIWNNQEDGVWDKF